MVNASWLPIDCNELLDFKLEIFIYLFVEQLTCRLISSLMPSRHTVVLKLINFLKIIIIIFI